MAIAVIVAQKVSYLGAFLAGLITFFTPCVLPLIPVWLALASGRATPPLTSKDTTSPLAAPNRGRALGATVFFILGFSLIFVALGAAASSLGSFFYAKRDILRLAGGIVMIAFGLSLLGLNLPFSSWLAGKRLAIPRKVQGYGGSFVVGLAFAAGWTPCVGPILGSILALAAIKTGLTQGATLLGLYSLGLGFPFLLAALLWAKIQAKLKGLSRVTVWASRVMGFLTLVLGVLFLFDKINALNFSYPY
ncbi:MAG: cytochrome c biogenesis CcdA family protein [Deltaproteobacteria bacterium]|nr:cytochrome c biogenesis CcdA family protein [Deltaproteobacteria bacterium]